MNFKTMIRDLRRRLAERRRFKAAMAEIQALTNAELADMGADRNELRQHVRAEIYG